ncbi:FAD-dependent oxidoreductase [Nocardia sp. NPDC004654]|uniref:FAD-dependent oxidoreductase n=1 Tax=Nocardia sp. NPDC004654 TaxID=3154776 RepID=UPI0033B4D92E
MSDHWTPRPAPSTIAQWDLGADVVIAGYGIAGVAAAIEAARAGADVLVLERTGGWGGAASQAGGFIYLGGGTPLQRALGFEDSPENMERFLVAALGRGIAIQLARSLGADVAHMDATEVAFFGDPQLLARGILVNGRGQRFVPEDTYPGRIGQEVLLRNENQAYLIIDEEALEAASATETATAFFRVPPKWAAESIAELESDMGLPELALQSTVQTYNHHAAKGSDPLLGKKPEWVRPLGTPVAGFDLRSHTAGFTLGGLRTDLDSRVLHVSGEPIPGLFAAGRCTAGLCAGGYVSGASLGDGSFYGRRAGISAAKSDESNSGK